MKVIDQMMTRFLLAVMPVVAVAFLGCSSQADSSKPNILFILVDDLGYYDLGYTGSQYYETPNVDRLAAQSYVFLQGYAACQVCSPSRASILSGQFTATHGITDWIGAKTGLEWNQHRPDSKVVPPAYKMSLDTALVTIPELLKQNGYRTFFAGKWHLGGDGSLPEDHGFDINLGGFHAGSPKGGYFAPFDNPALPGDIPRSTNLSMYLAEQTGSFLKENSGNPFFAMLSFYAVHGPIETTRAKWEKYRDKADAQGIHDTGFEMEKILPIRQYQDNPVYGGLVEQMDDAVGRVMFMLDSLGLSDNTIVIFTSDNGGVASGDAFSTTNAPLRGGKGYQWEGGLKVPFLIRMPGIQKEVQLSYPVSSVDLFPTICDWVDADFQNSEQLEGISLTSLMDGKEVLARPLFWHYPHYGNQGGEPVSIVRLGRWKLIHYWEDDHLELYDVLSDVSESQDLSLQHMEKAKELNVLLMTWLEIRGARLPIPYEEYDHVIAENFRKSNAERKRQFQENRRKQMLSESYKPNDDWWGSE